MEASEELRKLRETIGKLKKSFNCWGIWTGYKL